MSDKFSGPAPILPPPPVGAGLGPFGAGYQHDAKVLAVLNQLEAEDRIRELEEENRVLREGLRRLQGEVARMSAAALRVLHIARRPAKETT